MANETAKLRNHSTEPPSEDRLNSWKEIAGYLKCSERTVRRWEEEGLPVHRHPHKAKAAIYAYKAEIDAWWRDGHEPLNQEHLQGTPALPARWWTRPWAMLTAALALVLASMVLFAGFGRRFQWFQPGSRNGQIRSIAVLPLANLSSDPEQDYLSDALTEALTNDLGKFSVLRVISRTSTMQYKSTKKTVPEIARELNVDAIIEGTVLHSGNRVRITANLIQANAPSRLVNARPSETRSGEGSSAMVIPELINEAARSHTESWLAWFLRRAYKSKQGPSNPTVER